MINLTPHEIPNSIKEFLQHGRNTTIGGFQPEHGIFLEINDLFSEFKQYAKENISETEIHAVRCYTFLSVENLKNSFKVNQKVKEFLKFKKTE